jgi:FdhD protein
VRRGTVTRRPVQHIEVRDGEVSRRTRRDQLATEEPLEIRLATSSGAADPLVVTMRTPGADFELTAGFLFAEGFVEEAGHIAGMRYCVEDGAGGPQQYNVVQVSLAAGAPGDVGFRRSFPSTSSCGVCGKASIDALAAVGWARVTAGTPPDPHLLLSLPGRLRNGQSVFERTGGLHAAAHFSGGGELLELREDVGRHNAMDKLVGAALLAGELPLAGGVVLLSGRISFELVQKAARAGVPVLAGVSAPSSLAVELAAEAGITLVGFLREGRFNVYTGRVAG